MNVLKEKNIIKKQVFDINYNGKVDALRLRQDIESLCKEKLIPQIELAIDKLNIPGRLIRIDQLNVEVNNLNSHNFINDLVPKAIEALEKAWNEKITPDAYEEKPYYASILDQLEYFLINGFLPWYAPSVSSGEWFVELEQALDETDEYKLSSLRQILLNPAARQRSIYLPDKIFWQIINAASGWEDGIQQSIKVDIERILSASGSTYSGNLNHLYKLVLIRHAAFNPEQEPVSFASELLQSLLKDENYFLDDLKSIKWKSKVFADAFSQFNKEPNGDVKDKAILEQSILNEKIPGRISEEEIKRELSEGIHILNAGLVIVAPYLNTFFSKLDLAERNELKKKEQALALLNYIVIGSETSAEFELVLPKILCGIPVEEVVDITAGVEEGYKIEAVELLKSVIMNWKALKNTSADGLREGFLQREGSLYFRNNEWLLVVEQKSYDVLLGQLPWSINFIYLPWMRYRLKVDWI